MKLNNFDNIMLSLSKASDGRWYGKAVGEYDKHGNELDACFPTVEEVVNCLLVQLEEDAV